MRRGPGLQAKAENHQLELPDTRGQHRRQDDHCSTGQGNDRIGAEIIAPLVRSLSADHSKALVLEGNFSPNNEDQTRSIVNRREYVLRP